MTDIGLTVMLTLGEESREMGWTGGSHTVR